MADKDLAHFGKRVRTLRERLGLPVIDPKAATAKSDKIEVCDPDKPDKKIGELKKPRK